MIKKLILITLCLTTNLFAQEFVPHNNLYTIYERLHLKLVSAQIKQATHRSYIELIVSVPTCNFLYLVEDDQIDGEQVLKIQSLLKPGQTIMQMGCGEHIQYLWYPNPDDYVGWPSLDYIGKQQVKSLILNGSNTKIRVKVQQRGANIEMTELEIEKL